MIPVGQAPVKYHPKELSSRLRWDWLPIQPNPKMGISTAAAAEVHGNCFGCSETKTAFRAPSFKAHHSAPQFRDTRRGLDTEHQTACSTTKRDLPTDVGSSSPMSLINTEKRATRRTRPCGIPFS